MSSCRKCGATPPMDKVCLIRVNELGVDGIWECRPTCGPRLSCEERLLLAIEAPDESPAPAGTTESEAR